MSLIAGDVAGDADATGVTITVMGDLDLAGGQKLVRRALPLIDHAEGHTLTLDLGGVGFCDSAGIAALVAVRKHCARHDWQMRTINLQPAVRRIVVDFGGLGPHLHVLDG